MSQPDTVTEPDHVKSSAEWAARSFRVFITAAAVVLFNQSLSAGEFMSGSYEFLNFHRLGASVAEFVVLFTAISAGVARFRRRYTSWPVGLTVLLLAAIQLQEFAGEERILSVHVPLGVSIITAVIGLTVWAWRES